MNRDRAIICVMAIVALIAWVVPGPAPIVTVVTTTLPAPGIAPVDLQASYGWASWYGNPFHGRKTANGTIYDMGGYSVAHKTVTMGTFVLITNLENGRWCVAVVNDRGPYIEGRDWDVSAAVAGRLGMIYRGVAPVKVKEINGGIK